MDDIPQKIANINPPQPVVYVQSQQVEEKPKSKLPILITIVIIAVLLIVAGVSFFIILNQPVKSIQKTVITKTPLNNLIWDTSDWETYSNSEKGISFKYPKDEFVNIQLAKTGDGFDFSGYQKIGPQDTQIKTFSVNIYMGFYLTYDEFVAFHTSEATGGVDNANIENVTVDGNQATRITGTTTKITDFGVASNYNLENVIYLVRRNGFIYVFWYKYREGTNIKEANLLDQIIETFKIIPVDPSSPYNLTTFKNETYSFMYPAKYYTFDTLEFKNCKFVTDDKDPQELLKPKKVFSYEHFLVSVCVGSGPMPTTFPYIDGNQASGSNDIRQYKSDNGSVGIIGFHTSMLGSGPRAILKRDENTYVVITSEIGQFESFLFYLMVSTFKFN